MEYLEKKGGGGGRKLPRHLSAATVAITMRSIELEKEKRIKIAGCVFYYHTISFRPFFFSFSLSWDFAKGEMARPKAINKSSVSPKQQTSNSTSRPSAVRWATQGFHF